MPDVITVTPLGNHRVHLRFADGVAGELDLARVIGAFTGVFAPLSDAAEFAKVHVNPETGTITWPTGADLCPDVLYSKLTGKPLPADAAEGDGS